MQGTETEFCDAWARRQHLSLTVTTNNRRKVKEREAGLPASPQEGPTAGGRRGNMIQQGQEEGVRLCAQCVPCTAHSPKHSHADPWNVWQTSAPGTCYAASPAAPQWAATLCPYTLCHCLAHVSHCCCLEGFHIPALHLHGLQPVTCPVLRLPSSSHQLLLRVEPATGICFLCARSASLPPKRRTPWGFGQSLAFGGHWMLTC